jgi:hypothetical protein
MKSQLEGQDSGERCAIPGQCEMVAGAWNWKPLGEFALG